MKLPTLALALTLTCSSVSGFVVPTEPSIVSTSTSTALEAHSRRQWLAVGAAAVFLPLASANAEPRPMYLTEPTDEFKANEAKAAEFRRVQLAQKKKFIDAVDKLLSEGENEEALAGDLKALRVLVIETEGLPIGIKKDDLYKQIRSKKAKGYWPTSVEIAYQSLKNEILFQQSPDSENKSEGSPY
ncbi:expressed unknown protein [Seminavis robusta]|uniref:Uncharacterized protein n=1 Tax=Seminavis robusta TaxID=568900 RepID=A0A9N8HB76_9STRA|nr:expressed unknown protein [Seminavis robusta]|eukprot:Sro351_g123930.1 n/a (186) ;mRNA; r:32373-33043